MTLFFNAIVNKIVNTLHLIHYQQTHTHTHIYTKGKYKKVKLNPLKKIVCI